jgi:hypothetical protein
LQVHELVKARAQPKDLGFTMSADAGGIRRLRRVEARYVNGINKDTAAEMMRVYMLKVIF